MKIRKHRIGNTIVILIGIVCLWILYFMTKDIFVLIVGLFGTLILLLFVGNLFYMVNFKDDSEYKTKPRLVV